jgi:tetratricopeptide (TPR) repeat protein
MYLENGQYESAIESLNIYVIYASENDRAFALLGQAYYELKDYQTSVDNFDKAEVLNSNGMRKYYIYRGLANLELENVDQAVDDLENALREDETSFEISLGLARGYFIQEKFGSTFVRAEVLKSLADTEEETALALYWHALSQEKRGEAKGAIKDWQELLSLDEDVMTAEMRAEAEQHLKAVVTPTNTSKPVTATQTKQSGTATPTRKPISTPTRTPTP